MLVVQRAGVSVAAHWRPAGAELQAGWFPAAGECQPGSPSRPLSPLLFSSEPLNASLAFGGMAELNPPPHLFLSPLDCVGPGAFFQPVHPSQYFSLYSAVWVLGGLEILLVSAVYDSDHCKRFSTSCGEDNGGLGRGLEEGGCFGLKPPSQTAALNGRH